MKKVQAKKTTQKKKTLSNEPANQVIVKNPPDNCGQKNRKQCIRQNKNLRPLR